MTFNTNILQAFAALAAGVVLTLFSVQPVIWLFDRFVITPYYYSHSLTEPADATNYIFDMITITSNIILGIGIVALVAAIFFSSRYISGTKEKWRRMVMMILTTFICAYTLLMILTFAISLE